MTLVSDDGSECYMYSETNSNVSVQSDKPLYCTLPKNIVYCFSASTNSFIYTLTASHRCCCWHSLLLRRWCEANIRQ